MSRQTDEQNSMNKISGGSHAEKTTTIRTYDAEAVAARMRQLREEVQQKKAVEAKKNQEIAAVPVEDADVAIAAESLNMEEAAAKRALQEKGGDLTALLREAVGLPRVRA